MNKISKQNGKISYGLVGFIGLISVLALILSWTAFNRSGQNVIPTVKQASNEANQEITTEIEDKQKDAVQNIDYAQSRIAFESRLLVIKADLVAKQVTDETMKNIQSLRKDVQETSNNVDGKLQSDLNYIDAELAQVELGARENTAEALLTLEKIIELIREDVETTKN